jgi:hypothetical protein
MKITESFYKRLDCEMVTVKVGTLIEFEKLC